MQLCKLCVFSSRTRRSWIRGPRTSSKKMAADESAWAWVKVVFDNYKQWETKAIRMGIASGKATYAEAQQAFDQVADAAAQKQKQAEVIFVESVDSTLHSTYRTSQAYPEASVAGLTLASCVARGSGNGTLLGNAPRRAVLTLLVLSAAFSRPLATRWGASVAAASKTVSDALKAQADAAGLLDR